jgi:hypothetical protein
MIPLKKIPSSACVIAKAKPPEQKKLSSREHSRLTLQFQPVKGAMLSIEKIKRSPTSLCPRHFISPT